MRVTITLAEMAAASDALRKLGTEAAERAVEAFENNNHGSRTMREASTLFRWAFFATQIAEQIEEQINQQGHHVPGDDD